MNVPHQTQRLISRTDEQNGQVVSGQFTEGVETTILPDGADRPELLRDGK
jgi:hypothetical protein